MTDVPKIHSKQEILKQLHAAANDNARQVHSAFITWYTFFWTLNMVAMAFIYNPQVQSIHGSSATDHMRLVSSLSALFVMLNALGIGACYYCWVSMSQLRHEAIAVMNEWIESEGGNLPLRPSAGLFPSPIMNYTFVAGGLSLVLNVLAWVLLPILT